MLLWKRKEKRPTYGSLVETGLITMDELSELEQRLSELKAMRMVFKLPEDIEESFQSRIDVLYPKYEAALQEGTFSKGERNNNRGR